MRTMLLSQKPNAAATGKPAMPAMGATAGPAPAPSTMCYLPVDTGALLDDLAVRALTFVNCTGVIGYAPGDASDAVRTETQSHPNRRRPDSRWR